MSFPEFPGSLEDTFPGIMFHPGEQIPGAAPHSLPVILGNRLCESRKRKAPDVSESSSGVSSHSPASTSGTKQNSVSPPCSFPRNIPFSSPFPGLSDRFIFFSASFCANSAQVEQRG